MGRYHRNPRPPQDLDSPAKLMFGLYQCLHHLSFLTGGEGNGKRPTFARKVEELDRFFIPALPTWNSNFKKQCHETNEKWRQEQIGNLTEHYQWCIEALKGSIFAYFLTTSDLTTHLNTAQKWAKQHFKRKFQTNIFDKVDQMVRKLKLSETTVKGPAPGNSSTNQAETKKVPTQEVPSTPGKRKRGRPSMGGDSPSVASPSETNSEKRSRSLTYSQTVKSPTFRPNATETQKNTPSVQKFRKLKSNERGQRMLSAWEIPKITKDLLVIGTSNLARISFVQRKDAQVISYSGLKLNMLLQLLQAFKFGPNSETPGRQPSHVVFSIGLNDRCLSTSTNETTLRKVYLEARRQFPDSKISFYEQPFDLGLPEKEKKTLVSLNDAIRNLCQAQKLNCIPRIPKAKFAVTDHDMIHWTENCANSTVEHLFDHLN